MYVQIILSSVKVVECRPYMGMAAILGMWSRYTEETPKPTDTLQIIWLWLYNVYYSGTGADNALESEVFIQI